ncbi:AtpZ/AtpI family protein [Hyphomicrobium sp. CS1GBMeth3]|uniref:AtpZ/AtpI family protein n=1 Tax=Hyphomicrobium sp. CS1GBMeth3 TaxID=1892845 RepID=UPI000931A84A|nr:AtpZ/AtpI family protein [Hyphomicrobium sp. CS1GBMeth3]
MSASNKDENPARGELSPEDREAFRKRASELGARLEKVRAEARSKEPPQGPDERTRGAAMGQAMKIAIELVVGIAVGGFIGKVLDDQFGTAPWFLILFLMLGFAAGLLNIIRTARRLQAEAEPLQRGAKAVPDDEDDAK